MIRLVSRWTDSTSSYYINCTDIQIYVTDCQITMKPLLNVIQVWELTLHMYARFWTCLRNSVRYQIKWCNYVIIIVFCLLWPSPIRYSNSDTRSGISSKLCSRRYSNHLIWWGWNFPKASVFCLLWSSLNRYSNSGTRSEISSKLRSRWCTNHLIWWGSDFSKPPGFCSILPFMV